MTVVEEATGSVGSPAGALQPRQLIVTLYGLYAREHGSWLSVAAVVRLMAALGVEEPAVRSSISRLKRRGLLDARRVDGVAGYALTEVAQEILADGDARIFGRRRAEEADGWLLVVFSVPESERDKRHQLRSQLTRLGFGTVAPGVWVAPGHLADEAGEVLDRRGLAGYVEFFRGAHLALGEVRDTVARWWDLTALHARYAEFLDRQEPVRDGSRPVTARRRSRRSPPTSGCSPTGGGCPTPTPVCRWTCCPPTGTGPAPPTCSRTCAGGWTDRPTSTPAG